MDFHNFQSNCHVFARNILIICRDFKGGSPFLFWGGIQPFLGGPFPWSPVSGWCFPPYLGLRSFSEGLVERWPPHQRFVII